MKAELNIETQELEQRVAERVISALKPLLNGRVEEDKLFTVETLAIYLGVSKQWVYERVQLKEIPHMKIGKFPRFKRKAIDQWLDTLSTPPVKLISSPLKRIKQAR
jgi:excisionase family DNA binding protein